MRNEFCAAPFSCFEWIKSALVIRRNARHTLPLRSLTDRYLRSRWIALLAWPALAAAQYPPTPGGSATGAPPTSGCEVQAADEAARVRCAMESVRQVDSRLNAEYIDLKSKLKGGEVSGLTETQRIWIRMRDQSCQLARDIRDRDAWLQHVAASAARTACVLIATNKRIGELESLRRQVDGIFVPAEVEPPADKPRVLDGAVETDAVTSANLRRRSVRAQRSGRHYFEIVIDEARAGDIRTNIVARISDGKRWTGVGHDVKARDLVLRLGPTDSIRIVGGEMGDLRVPKLVIGVAIDLDARRMYWHRDGVWQDGAMPDSGRGILLTPAADMFAELAATVPVDNLSAKGIVQPNFGDVPFSGYQPAGYRGFDWPDHLGDVPAAAPVAGSVQATGRIAGATQLQWIQRYAEWIRSFPKSVSPATDPTGERCGAGQSGAMWFLAGTRELGKVRRECTVAAGKAILVPIINTVAQAPGGMACDQMQVAVKKFTEGASGLRFSLDGKAWQDIEKHKLGTGCFQLRDGTTGAITSAVTSGYWIFLPPLATGSHVIEFGGRFKVDGFEQDVTYVLQVR